MEAGRLVPDEVVIDVVMEAIDGEEIRPGGYVLDGFPRTFRQAEALEKVLKKRKEKLDRVILIDTPDEVVRERLAQRRSCPDPLCGAVYNVKSKPPKVEGVCDLCGKALVIRDDDRPETIRVRQQQYWHDTAPLVDFYERASLLVEIAGDGPLDEVAGRIMEAVSKIKRPTTRKRRGKVETPKNKDGQDKSRTARNARQKAKSVNRSADQNLFRAAESSDPRIGPDRRSAWSGFVNASRRERRPRTRPRRRDTSKYNARSPFLGYPFPAKNIPAALRVGE